MPIATSVLINIAVSIAISAALMVVKLLFARPTPQPASIAQQRPADGKYNLKQSVPSRRVILGTAKVSPDYLALMERYGHAHHVMVNCAHKIDGIVSQYLHDEEITVADEATVEGTYGGHVISPGHFENYVAVGWRLGEDVEKPYAGLVAELSDIWTNDHRGDGLATVAMDCFSIDQNKYLRVFPNQTPQYSNVVRGALVYDPREESHDPNDKATWTFSRNLALLRFHHITHPFGGRRSISDMYIPDWIHAANVCDDVVYNRNGDPEFRYHGGIDFRYKDDQVEVGWKIDQAADLVLYERADGLIGVHAGQFYTPTFRVTAKEIKEINYDANKRSATTVLAVRGRFVDPDARYNEADAAIWGDPYIGEGTERTKDVTNKAVQSHNHMQRLQKLTMIRANAPKVAVQIVYNPTSFLRGIIRERFVKIHYPDLGLNEAVLEVTGRPKRSLMNQTITFEGIIIPPDLFDFDAITEEGEFTSGVAPTPIVGVPVPEDFVVSIARANVNGQPIAYAVAEWSFVDGSLNYEFEWQYSDEREPPQSVLSKPEELNVQSLFLSNDEEYRFRLRTWSNGASSDWTDYETILIATSYYNKAASFGGSSYFNRTTDLTGIVNGKTGTFSAWIKMNGGDGTIQSIVCSNDALADAHFVIFRNASNKIEVKARNTLGSAILEVESTIDVEADGSFHHVLIAFDLAASYVRIYIDDANATGVPSTLTDDTIAYADGNFYVASDSVPDEYLNADIAELWFDTSFIDVGVTANRRKFINVDGGPKYLSTDGSIPLGGEPLVYCAILPEQSAGADFVLNRGTGGGFTSFGTIGVVTGPS